jgi:hypothetical protein
MLEVHFPTRVTSCLVLKGQLSVASVCTPITLLQRGEDSPGHFGDAFPGSHDGLEISLTFCTSVGKPYAPLQLLVSLTTLSN